MDPINPQTHDKNNKINLPIVGILSQVGVLTIVIIIGFLLVGMFLDSRLNTKPWFTIGLIIASVPVSLVVMVIVAKAMVKKIRPEKSSKGEIQEDRSIGN